MFTSDRTKSPGASSFLGRDTKVWIGITIFTIIFAAVYEHFSFGVYSAYMIFMFAFPLLLGVAPSLTLHLKDLANLPVFWNEGVIVLTFGSMLTGIFEIYGTDSNLTKWFFLGGSALLIIGAVGYLISAKNSRE